MKRPSCESKRTTCKRCHKHKSEVGEISWGGNCKECGNLAALANSRGLRTHSGEEFLHYRRRIVAAFGGVLLDDMPEKGYAPRDGS